MARVRDSTQPIATTNAGNGRRFRNLARVSAAAFVLSCPHGASGDAAPGDGSSLTIAVDVAAADRVEAWRASAFERVVALELAEVAELEVIESGANAEDPAGGPDVVFAGVLGADRLQYEIRRTDRRLVPRAARGTIALDAADRGQLGYEVRRAVSAELAAPAETLAAGSAAAAATDRERASSTAAVALVVGCVALLLSLPLGVGAVAMGWAQLGHVVQLTSFRATLLISLGLALAPPMLASAGLQALEGWPVSMLGGLAWGWFAAVLLAAVFPPHRGLERVEPGDLFRVLAAWSVVSLVRLVRTAAVYAPFVVVWWLASRALAVDADVSLALLAPACGLLARFWHLSLLENLALWLDRELGCAGAIPAGRAGSDDPWSVAVRAYFMGYVRRAGWPADDHLLDGIVFLAGPGDGITTYGGGLGCSRVVIGTELLEFATAPLGRPHDYAQPRASRLHWTEWNAGLVVPVELSAPIATPQQRQPRHTPLPGETEHLPIGQPPTLIGYVEPDAVDDRPSYRPEEDPLRLDWDPGEEHDGTDPSDKDCLFGALVHELGVVQRGDHEFSTIAEAMRRRLASSPSLAVLARALGRLGAVLRVPFARHRAIVADGFAALNFARHHLMQYLAWRHLGRDDLLTARAFAPEMAKRTRDIARELGQKTGQSDGALSGPTLRKRLLWLAEHGRAAPAPGRRVARRVALAFGLLALLIALALGVGHAVDYHPTYLEQLESPGDRDLPDRSTNSPDGP